MSIDGLCAGCDESCQYADHCTEPAVLKAEIEELESEADQLRARIAALEAEVARLKEPVRLVFEDYETERQRSQMIIGCFYEVGKRMDWTWYATFVVPGFCTRAGEKLSYETKSQAIAACAAHHLARYREMQGAL